MAVFGSLRMVLYTKALHHFTFEEWAEGGKQNFQWRPELQSSAGSASYPLRTRSPHRVNTETSTCLLRHCIDASREEHAKILCKLTDIVDAGGLHPVLDEQKFFLEEAGKAHDRLSSGQAIGKVVVEI